ncbi:unnamed protein product [Rhodiola kirilowii]
MTPAAAAAETECNSYSIRAYRDATARSIVGRTTAIADARCTSRRAEGVCGRRRVVAEETRWRFRSGGRGARDAWRWLARRRRRRTVRRRRDLRLLRR